MEHSAKLVTDGKSTIFSSKIMKLGQGAIHKLRNELKVGRGLVKALLLQTLVW